MSAGRSVVVGVGSGMEVVVVWWHGGGGGMVEAVWQWWVCRGT